MLSCVPGVYPGNCAHESSVILMHKSATRVIALDLSPDSIGVARAKKMFQALCSNKSLYNLKMGWTGWARVSSLGSNAIETCRTMLSLNQVLAELDIAMAEIRSSSVTKLSAVLAKNKTPQVLNLSSNDIQSRGETAAIQACIRCQIRELNMVSTQLREDASSSFTQFLSKSWTIRVPEVPENSLTSQLIRFRCPLTRKRRWKSCIYRTIESREQALRSLARRWRRITV